MIILTIILVQMLCVINRQNNILKYGMRGHFHYRRQQWWQLIIHPCDPFYLAGSSSCKAKQKEEEAFALLGTLARQEGVRVRLAWRG